MQFKVVRNGYDVDEVEKYLKSQEMNFALQSDKQKDRIRQLVTENEQLRLRLQEYIKKEASISNALVNAVDKAKQIEESSKKIYDIEIQKIRLLFNKYKVLLDDLMKNNADASSIKSTKAIMEDFKKSINTTIPNNSTANAKTVSAYDPMHALLNKMNNYIAQRNAANNKVSVENLVEDESDSHVNEKANIKPISNVELKENERFENVVDKFLSEGDGETNAFSKQIFGGEELNNGFDLKEAVNPTDSLEEIMKDFDFYLGDED